MSRALCTRRGAVGIINLENGGEVLRMAMRNNFAKEDRLREDFCKNA